MTFTIRMRPSGHDAWNPSVRSQVRVLAGFESPLGCLLCITVHRRGLLSVLLESATGRPLVTTR